MDSNEIVVSVISLAFNHEPYVRQALEGFVMQKTKFKYEVLVHDDASTDKTADIIREYAEKYPDIIKPIFQTENQYSKKVNVFAEYIIPRTKGRYLALCECDDYWTDPLKLQKQVDALEAHPECDMCAHRAILDKMSLTGRKRYVAPADEDTILTAGQMIMGGGGYVATDSLLFRRELYDDIPEFRKFIKIDYSLQIQGALRGGIVYLNDCMSAYRIRRSGSYTSESLKSKEKQIEFYKKTTEMRNILNKETNYQYNDEIRKTNLMAQVSAYKILGQFDELKKEPYKSLCRRDTLKQKIWFVLERYCPQAIKFWRYWL